MVVKSPNWNEKQATLQKFERKNKLDKWIPVEEKFDVVVGKNGMGWGKDFVSFANSDEPRKTEGDGKSPAGIFLMGDLFGFEQSSRAGYRQLKDSTYCIDDQDSEFYNQIIDSADPKITSNPPHNEKMREQVLYKIGAEIKYLSSRKLGTGSCIFMHIWKDSTHGTAGCVAMEETNIQKLVQWMNPKLSSAVAIFPKDTYDKYKTCVGLP